MGCRVKGFWREQKLYIAQGFAFDVLYIYSLCVFLLFLSFHFCSLLCLVFVGIISKFRKLRTTKRKQACLVTDVIKKVSLLMSASICSVEFILNVKEQRLLFVLFSWIFTNNFTPWNNTLVCLFVYVCVCVLVLQVAPSLPRLHPACSPQPLLPPPPPCTRPPPPSGSVRCPFWTAAPPMPYWTPLPMTSSLPTPTCSVHSPPPPVRAYHCTAACSILSTSLSSSLSPSLHQIISKVLKWCHRCILDIWSDISK